MSVAFFHDHVFVKVGNNYYSPGKLDYSKTKFYVDMFGFVTIVSRYKVSDCIPNGYLIANGESVRVVGMPNLSSIKTIFQRGNIKNEIVEIINEHDNLIARLPSEYGLLCLELAKKLKREVLTEVVANAFDCLFYQPSLAKKIYSYILESRVRSAVSNSLFVSYVTKEYLQRKYPASKSALTLGISDVVINNVVEPVKSIERHDPVRLLVIANPDLDIKSVDTAVKATVLLSQQGYHCRLDVLGGEGRAYIEKYGSLPSNVTFHAAVPSIKVMEFIDSAHIYIQPSLTEGMPRALLEAMSRGLPCCTTPVGGMKDVVHQSCLFQKKNIEALAKVLVNLINDDHFYRQMSEHSVKVVLDGFLNAEVVGARIDFYKKYKGCTDK